ncbi:MAG TPA: hypothetical protein VFZ44_02265 [Pyrinomonadaceae bacterium]
MKKSLALLAALFILTAGCSALRSVSSQDKTQDKAPESAISGDRAQQAEVMKELRNKLLTAKPDELLEGEDAKAKVWGVLMDVTFPSGTATLVSLRDGTASLYTTGGGGVLGGYVAREQAKEFVVAAEKHLGQMRPTEAFPYPANGRVKFYVLTRDGVLTGEAGLSEMGERKHKLWTLYYAADQVLTQLRLASEKNKQ